MEWTGRLKLSNELVSMALSCRIRGSDRLWSVLEDDLVLYNLNDLKILRRRLITTTRLDLLAFTALNDGDSLWQLLDFAGEPLVLPNEQMNTLHPRRAFGIRYIIGELQSPELKALLVRIATRARRQVDCALELNKREA